MIGQDADNRGDRGKNRCQPRSSRDGFLAGGMRGCASASTRASTHDRQTLGLHLRAMRSYAQDRGWVPVQQIEDVVSGASGSARFFDGSPSGLALQLSDVLWNATIVTPVA